MTQDNVSDAITQHERAILLLKMIGVSTSRIIRNGLEDTYSAHMYSLCAAHISGDYAQDFGKPMPVTDQETQY